MAGSGGTGSQRLPDSQFVDGSSDAQKIQKCFIGVTGMTRASCVANIERNLLKHRGEDVIVLEMNRYVLHLELI